KVGGKLGGIIATMPAVYLAAIIALAIDHKGQQLIQMSIHLSTGAIVGIISCIVTVFFTSISGTVFAILCWFVISVAIFLVRHI
ncbi:MAG: DUF3147 family protein, partial [Staphylococcus epidermidis]|nr:DUF3147 family protein [Staphylococcus epidermidis]